MRSYAFAPPVPLNPGVAVNVNVLPALVFTGAAGALNVMLFSVFATVLHQSSWIEVAVVSWGVTPAAMVMVGETEPE